MTTTVNTSTQTTLATLETAKARALHFVDGIHGTVFLTEDSKAFHFDGKEFVLKSTKAIMFANEIAFEHNGLLIVSSNGRFIVSPTNNAEGTTMSLVLDAAKLSQG